MALFRISLSGLHEQSVVELDVRDMEALQQILGPGRFVRGRLDGDGESIEVLIPVSRIQLVLAVSE